MSPRRPIFGAIELLALLFLLAALALAAWYTTRQATPGLLGACEMPADGRPLVVLVSVQSGRLVAQCIRIRPRADKARAQAA